MYESTVIQKLNTLLSEKEEAAMLLPESCSQISDYQNILNEYTEAKHADIKSVIEGQIMKQFSLKKDGWNYWEDGEPSIPVYKMLRQKIGANGLFSQNHSNHICEELLQKVYRRCLLIERTQQTLRDEKFKPDIKPIVTLITEEKRDSQYRIEKIHSVVVIIINNHSFVRLKISHEKVEERIQRAVRKDIIDVLLRDKQLSFVFHSIRDQICIELENYKEARELQEAIHAIRNTPLFTRNNSR